VVGAESAPDGAELVFVTSDAQLLRFPAASVRPQGAPAGGMAGVNLSAGAGVIHFTATGREDVVAVTISGAEAVIPGTDAGRVKVSRFDEFPAKGRATGGVRAHTFLKGENRLTLAWVGPAPVLAVGPDGAVRQLPAATSKRDASGQPLDAVIGSIGRTLV
jgi:DNA gyrase subunit A